MKIKKLLKSPMSIASEWHGGQASPLYAYSCNGHIDNSLLKEVIECWNLETTTCNDRAELAHLWCAVADKLTMEDMSSSEYWHRTAKNADGSPLRVRKTGQLKTWKTRPNEFKLPVKYGLKDSFYITHENVDEWCLPLK